ncbi:MAG: tetratricopeptide repeat protein, partial [Planctomycetota bacterium]
MEKIFDAARRLTPETRDAFLEKSCGEDTALRQEVEELLESATDAAQFLETPAARIEGPEPEVGREIGPFTVREVLGEGAFGVVYLAEQTTPVRRRVALKVLKPGMDSKEVLARFEAERQALALMDPPGIARIHEVGETPRGRPYFAMEHVRGLPVTEYCDQERLDTEERLKLVIEICHAVQHAHQKGILHRALKPSNILVELVDSKPQVKVIDLGLTRAMGSSLTQKTLHTEIGRLMGTPEYMSPEQAEMSGLDLDTRTDIYALGVILYELLVGRLPIDAKTLRSSLPDLQKRIREQEPERPSRRLTTLGQDADVVARVRRTDTAGLRRELKGDLDWITLCAMDKDRARRYASASEFAADIERHLRDEPVSAGPPTASYRLTKFARRHRGLVGAAAALFIALVVGFATTLWQAREAERARDEAERIGAEAQAARDFLLKVLTADDPFAKENISADDSVHARLDFAAERVSEALGEHPNSEAAVRETLGSAYRSLNLVVQAEAQMQLALRRYQELFGREDPRAIRLRSELSLVLRDLARDDEALATAADAHTDARKVLGADDPLTLTTANNHALMLKNDGQLEEAEQLYREILERRQRVLGEASPHTLVTTSNLGQMLREQGRLDESEDLTRRALRGYKIAFGQSHPDTLMTLDILGGILTLRGEHAEAERCHREALEGFRKVLGEDHKATLGARWYLAGSLLAQGKLDEAGRELEESDRICTAKFGPKAIYTLLVRNLRTKHAIESGNLIEAERFARDVADTLAEIRGPNSTQTLSARGTLARVLLERGQSEEACALAGELVSSGREAFGASDSRLADLRFVYVRTLRAVKRSEEA